MKAAKRLREAGPHHDADLAVPPTADGRGGPPGGVDPNADARWNVEEVEEDGVMHDRARPAFAAAPPDAPASGAGAGPPSGEENLPEPPPDAVTVRVPSEFAEAYRVRDEVIAEARPCGYDESAVFGVQLAFDEAIANAIIHGCARRDDSTIEITYHVRPEGIYLSIRDEGEGFDPDSVDDPTRDENLEIPAGRGLFLMRAYMSRVEFNRRGNVVVMIHERGLDNEAEAADDSEAAGGGCD